MGARTTSSTVRTNRSPAVFINDAEFASRWQSDDRYYLATFADQRTRIERLAGKQNLYPLQESGGKLLFTNQPAEPATQ